MSQTKNERGGPLGGQELPPEVQDRPEQNRGYDDAVQGKSGRPGGTEDRGEDRNDPSPGQTDGER